MGHKVSSTSAATLKRAFPGNDRVQDDIEHERWNQVALYIEASGTKQQQKAWDAFKLTRSAVGS